MSIFNGATLKRIVGNKDRDKYRFEININNTEETTKTDEEMTSKDIKDLKNYLSQYYEIDKKIIDIQIK